MPAATIPLLVLAYLVGTLPTAHLVGRRAGHDPTAEGSGNPGATNIGRLAGPGPAAVVLAVDLAKGALAALAGLAVGGQVLGVAAGMAAVLGHVFPVTRGLRGGKGVATGAGVVLVLWPWAALAGLAAWLLAAGVSRRVWLGSLAAAVTVVVSLAVRGAPAIDLVAASVLALVVVARHRGNAATLRRGATPPTHARR